VKRYVLLFRGAAPPQSDLDKIAAAPGVRIIDH